MRPQSFLWLDLVNHYSIFLCKIILSLIKNNFLGVFLSSKKVSLGIIINFNAFLWRGRLYCCAGDISHTHAVPFHGCWLARFAPLLWNLGQKLEKTPVKDTLESPVSEHLGNIPGFSALREFLILGFFGENRGNYSWLSTTSQEVSAHCRVHGIWNNAQCGTHCLVRVSALRVCPRTRVHTVIHLLYFITNWNCVWSLALTLIQGLYCSEKGSKQN